MPTRLSLLLALALALSVFPTGCAGLPFDLQGPLIFRNEAGVFRWDPATNTAEEILPEDLPTGPPAQK